MVESLCCAEEWLQTEPCIVSYSDIFYEVPAVKCLIDNQDLLALTYDPNWLSFGLDASLIHFQMLRLFV